MQIQVNTDRHIAGGSQLTQQVHAAVTDAVGRFAARVTRVEVHLTDENSGVKGGADDIRCVLEARLAGLKPISVSNRAASLDQAYLGAAEKLERALTRTLEKRQKVKGRTPYGGETV
jgi:ribosome-associated translation inhibitor RaiA